MIKKEDLRILKSKKKIKKSFMSIIDDKEFNKISIKEICLKAGVTRKTFYNNFQNKYELFLGIIKDKTKDIHSDILKQINESRISIDIDKIVGNLIFYLSQLLENNKKVIAKFNIYDNSNIYILIESISKKEIKNFILEIQKKFNLKPIENIDTLISFFVNGCIICVSKWSKQTNAKKEDIIKTFKKSKESILSVCQLLNPRIKISYN